MFRLHWRLSDLRELLSFHREFYFLLFCFSLSISFSSLLSTLWKRKQNHTSGKEKVICMVVWLPEVVPKLRSNKPRNPKKKKQKRHPQNKQKGQKITKLSLNVRVSLTNVFSGHEICLSHGFGNSKSEESESTNSVPWKQWLLLHWKDFRFSLFREFTFSRHKPTLPVSLLPYISLKKNRIGLQELFWIDVPPREGSILSSAANIIEYPLNTLFMTIVLFWTIDMGKMVLQTGRFEVSQNPLLAIWRKEKGKHKMRSFQDNWTLFIRRTSLESGMDGYLTKPLDPSLLLHHLDKCRKNVWAFVSIINFRFLNSFFSSASQTVDTHEVDTHEVVQNYSE